MIPSLNSFVPNAHFLYHLGGKEKGHLEKMVNPNKTDVRSIVSWTGRFFIGKNSCPLHVLRRFNLISI